jgi:hypothetical protein
MLAVLWMVVGITMCGILTGHMASDFSRTRSLGGIASADDLAGRTVCMYVPGLIFCCRCNIRRCVQVPQHGRLLVFPGVHRL